MTARALCDSGSARSFGFDYPVSITKAVRFTVRTFAIES